MTGYNIEVDIEFVEKIVSNELKRDLALFREELEKPGSVPMYHYDPIKKYHYDPIKNAKKARKMIKALELVLEFYGEKNA